jgi:hypothetical protein
MDNLTMGWLKPAALAIRREGPAEHQQTVNQDDKKIDFLKQDDTFAQHLETIDIHDNTTQHTHYPIQPVDLAPTSLPFISSAIVRSAQNDLERT